MPSITGLSHVDLTVTDLDRAERWYSTLLGTSTVLAGENEEEGFRVKYLQEPASGFILGLVEHRTKTGNGFDARVTGLDHLSLAVTDRDALRAWKARLDDMGIANDGVSEQGVGAGLNFCDPDGIALEFYVIDPQPTT